LQALFSPAVFSYSSAWWSEHVASQSTLDLEALLAPIPGDNPAGAPLKYAGDFDEIKALLPKPDRDAFESGGQEGQWAKIVQLATQKLRSKSKDLQIASWLTEALVHLHGFAGLRDGLRLLHGLCEQFWEGVYPLPDDGDLEMRAAPLQSLLAGERNSAALWIGEIPLASSPIHVADTDEHVPASYNLWHSIVVSQLADKKPLQDLMETAMSNSPTPFFQNLLGDLQAADDALQTLKGLIDERFGAAAPSTVGVAEALSGCKNRITSILAKRGIRTAPEEANGSAEAITASESATSGAASAGSGGSRPAGPISSRDEALSRLREVADFFRRTEPHSPVPFLIQRAINWSRMSFDQLILELVKDENSRLAINSTLGISLGEAPVGESPAPSGNGQEGSGW
jgi:type VI secretion system protein ImpA